MNDLLATRWPLLKNAFALVREIAALRRSARTADDAYAEAVLQLARHRAFTHIQTPGLGDFDRGLWLASVIRTTASQFRPPISRRLESGDEVAQFALYWSLYLQDGLSVSKIVKSQESFVAQSYRDTDDRIR